jgi:glycosidase
MSDHPPDWVQDAVFYQIFPDRFAASNAVPKPPNLEPWDSPPTVCGFKGGDLRGITERLDYLGDLGITALYLNPIFQSAANHRYHTHDYYRVDPILGGDAAFRDLLAAARARSIRVVLDGVFNHASRGFFPFSHVLENGPDSPYLDWFHVKGFPLYAYHQRRKPNYDAWWNLRALPKFNTENPAVREFLMGVAEHWIREGIDGWRLDVPREIKTPGFWEEFRRRTKAVNPEAYLVGEIWNEAEGWLDGTRFDAVMNYVFTRACLGFFGGEALDTSFRPGGYRLKRLTGAKFSTELARIIATNRWETTLAQLNLLGSHDTPRFLTAVRGDRRRLKLAVLCQVTFPGVPCLYYGDEIGLEGGKDPGCRGAFPWDEDRWDHDLLAWTRRCIALRHSHAALRRGSFVPLAAGRTTCAFARRLEKELLVAVFNTGAGEAAVRLPGAGLIEKGSRVRDCFHDRTWNAEGRKLELSLPPLGGTVLEVMPAG